MEELLNNGIHSDEDCEKAIDIYLKCRKAAKKDKELKEKRQQLGNLIAQYEDKL